MIIRPAVRRAVVATAFFPVLVSPAIAAEPFQWEVGGDYLDREVTISGTIFDPIGNPVGVSELDFGSDTLALGAQWFLEPITADSGPLEQAAFLERATSLSAIYVRTDNDADSDVDAIGVGGRYQFDNDWFVTGTLTRAEAESGLSESESTVVTAGVGRYLGQRTALELSVSRDFSEVSGPGFSFDDDFTSYDLNLQHVGDIGAQWQYAVDASLIVPDGEFDQSGLGLAVTLYPSRFFGFGFDSSLAIDDTSDRPQAYSVFGRWFINEAWSVSARYEWVEQDFSGIGFDVDDRAYGVGLRYRF